MQAPDDCLAPSELQWARRHGLAGGDDPPPRPDPPMRADTAADFDDIEAEVARRLGATPERCAFLRTYAYLDFRRSALYSARKAQTGVFTPCGIHLAYAPDARGGSVTVRAPREPPVVERPDPCSEVQFSYRVVVPGRRPGRPRKVWPPP